jgi:ATP-dependent exoDNAse (exonuclease V) beta subunit
MQWQNLIPLIDNATSSEFDGEKGTLMIVGDPKQSIYRWRGGKAEQFIELSKDKNPFNNPDKEAFHLDKNYRSYSQIIDFNNDFFQLLSNEFSNPDYKNLYENHSRQKSNDKKGGYVNISFLPEIQTEETEGEEELNKTDLYVRAIVKTIQEVRQKGFKYSEIAVLIRHKKNGTAIANCLIEQGIPILSSETLLIKNATEVRIIIYLLRFLNNKANLEAKAYFLEYLAQSNVKPKEIHDFIAQGMKQYDETDFEKWLMNYNISISFKNSRKKSLYEAVEIIISSVLKIKTSTAYLQYFLDIIIERDVRNHSGIADFLAYWDKNAEKFKIPSPEGSDAIQIMTIHKSKGLEFPVVIFPFAEENYSNQKKDKLWVDFDKENFGLSKVLLNNNKTLEGFGNAVKETYLEKSEEQLLDNINVLYVALTRAEEQLYVISNLFKPNKEGQFPNNMATFFVKYLTRIGSFAPDILEYHFGNSQKLSPETQKQKELKIIPQVVEKLNPKNIKIAQKEALMWGTHQQEAIEYGNVIHEILSFVKTKQDVDLAITKAIENGLITIKQKQIVSKTINEIVNHPELLSCFSLENKFLNEQTIIQKEGAMIKPDRMVLTQNKEVYLLDYKTGTHYQKYQLQLDKYQVAIELMGYKVVKKSLVYIGEKITVLDF